MQFHGSLWLTLIRFRGLRETAEFNEIAPARTDEPRFKNILTQLLAGLIVMDNNGLGKTLKDVDVGVRKHWDDTSDADVANEYADQLYNEVLRNEVENGKISFERGAEIIDALLESATMGAFLNNLPLKTEDLLAHKLNDKLGEIYTRKDVNPMYIHGSTINGLAIRLTYGLGMHEILKASKGQ